jgi:hypothetical protein
LWAAGEHAFDASRLAGFFRETKQGRSAGRWWPVLIRCEKKILLAGWWLVAGAELL